MNLHNCEQCQSCSSRCPRLDDLEARVAQLESDLELMAKVGLREAAYKAARRTLKEEQYKARERAAREMWAAIKAQPMPDYLSTEDLAQHFGLSPSGLILWRQHAKFPHYVRKDGRMFVWESAPVLNWIEWRLETSPYFRRQFMERMTKLAQFKTE